MGGVGLDVGHGQRLLAPVDDLVHHRPERELPEIEDQVQRGIDIAVVDRVPVSGSEVRKGSLESPHPSALVRAGQPSCRLDGPPAVEGDVTTGEGLGLLGSLVETGPGEHPNRLQLAVGADPVAAVQGQHRLVDEARQVVEDLGHLEVVEGADVLGRVELELAHEDREAVEQPTLPAAEEVVGPRDRVGQGPVAGGSVSHLLAEQRESTVEPLGDVVDAERAKASSRQLEGEGEAVELTADVEHRGGRRLVDDEIGPDPSAPFEEELYGGRLERIVAGELERRDRPHALSLEPEGLPTGGQHGHVGRGVEHRRDERGHAVDHVLAVVEHEQRPSGPEHLEETVTDVSIGVADHVEAGADGSLDLVGVRDRGQLAEPRPVGVAVGHLLRDGYGQPGLSHAAGPEQGHEPLAVEDLDDRRELLVSSQQRGLEGGERPVRLAAGRGRHADDDPLAVLGHLHLGDELVAPPVGGADGPLGPTVVADRLAGSLEPRRQGRLAHEPITPDLVEELRFGDHSIPVLDEVGEHVEHLRFDVDLLPLVE